MKKNYLRQSFVSILLAVLAVVVGVVCCLTPKTTASADSNEVLPSFADYTKTTLTEGTTVSSSQWLKFTVEEKYVISIYGYSIEFKNDSAPAEKKYALLTITEYWGGQQLVGDGCRAFVLFTDEITEPNDWDSVGNVAVSDLPFQYVDLPKNNYPLFEKDNANTYYTQIPSILDGYTVSTLEITWECMDATSYLLTPPTETDDNTGSNDNTGNSGTSGDNTGSNNNTGNGGTSGDNTGSNDNTGNGGTSGDNTGSNDNTGNGGTSGDNTGSNDNTGNGGTSGDNTGSNNNTGNGGTSGDNTGSNDNTGNGGDSSDDKQPSDEPSDGNVTGVAISGLVIVVAIIGIIIAIRKRK